MIPPSAINFGKLFFFRLPASCSPPAAAKLKSILPSCGWWLAGGWLVVVVVVVVAVVVVVVVAVVAVAVVDIGCR